MANIIVNYRPFTITQEIFVYDNGICVELLQAPIDKIPDTVNGLQSRYNIEQINLCGIPSSMLSNTLCKLSCVSKSACF